MGRGAFRVRGGSALTSQQALLGRAPGGEAAAAAPSGGAPSWVSKLAASSKMGIAKLRESLQD